MFRIYVRKPGHETGHVYKAHRSIKHDKLTLLHYGFVIAGIIQASEWMKAQ